MPILLSRANVFVAFVFFLVVLPLISIPLFGIQDDVGRDILAAFITGIFLASTGIGLLSGRIRNLSFPFLLSIPLMLLGVAAVSAAYAHGFAIGLASTSFELGTAGSFALALTAFLSSAQLPRAPIRRALILCITVVSLGAFLSIVFPVSVRGAFISGEGRQASLYQTTLITGSAYSDSVSNVLFGVGPGAYSHAWMRYRPGSFNSDPNWNVRFTAGPSTATTVAVELGLIGLFGLVLLAALPVVLCVRALAGDQRESAVSLILGSAAMASVPIIVAFFFRISLPSFLLASVGFGFLVRLAEEKSAPTPMTWNFAIGVCGLLGGIVIASCALMQFLAAFHDARADQALREGKIEEALLSFERASFFWNIPASDVRASRAALGAATQIAQSSPNPDAALLQRTLGRAMETADRAIAADPRDYFSWRGRAFVYTSLVAGGLSDKQAEAEESIAQATQLGPTMPDIFFMAAQLALLEGKPDEARASLSTALGLKADYEDAQKLLHSLRR